ncbi:mucin-5AC isoform X3 [Siniperca chuatsi]|uniref:mucin-5AC isoform X3 n=1 Tax=Siniperca chuatsi TaxID=119488 RepID=UPI001CE0EE29|nr:mucin-5AC isoform X3 [Siniperca chuatsi]
MVLIPFFQKGIVQVFGQRRGLQLGSPQCVFPGVLQCCLSYSLITRLAPSWNKAGLYLVSGKDFLTERGRLNAVRMELSTSEGQLCISIDANAVRLLPTTVRQQNNFHLTWISFQYLMYVHLEDFDLPPLVLRRFCGDPDSVLDPTSTGRAIWCHVLPSMKKGQIITISRQLPRDGPFRTYRDLQNHWNRLYGYRLPELAEEEVVYCSVYFRLVGQRLFTYPLSCIRLQPLQRCPRADLQGALGSFLSDVRARLQSVCGFPARLTSKPRYHTVSLNTAATVQVLSGEQINLTTSSSMRPVLTQLPAPPPPPPRPVKPPFGSQPPAWAPLSQQDGAQGPLGNGCGFGGRLTQSQGCRGDGAWPSSSSSSSRVSFSDSSGYQSASSVSSSSSSLPLFQPASSLTSSSSSSSTLSSSSVLSPLPPPSQTPVIPAPKLVPIFKNKCPSRHVNVALLRVQKQREQLGGAGEERRRVTLPAFKKKTPATASSSYSLSSVSSLSAASLPIPPLPTIPRFNRRPRSHSGTTPQPTGHPKLKHLLSLSPASKSKPGLILTPKPEVKPKSSLKTNVRTSCESNTAANSSRKAAPPEPPRPLTSSDVSYKDTSTSSRGGVAFETKPKKSRSAIQDVDVEKMARSNQLSKLNSATLLSWLRGRGALVSAKHKKQELMLKVMACLAEA